MTDNLIVMLQQMQEEHGYISMDMIKTMSEQTGIKPAKILGVVTFYAQFRMEPVGRYVIMLCQGTACHVNGSAELVGILEQELKISAEGTTADGMFTLTNVACLGCCSLSPAMMIRDEATGESATYGSLTREKVREIIGEYIKRADAHDH